VAGTTRRHTFPQPQLPGLRRPHNPVVVTCARARLRIRSAALARPVYLDPIWPAQPSGLHSQLSPASFAPSSRVGVVPGRLSQLGVSACAGIWRSRCARSSRWSRLGSDVAATRAAHQHTTCQEHVRQYLQVPGLRQETAYGSQLWHLWALSWQARAFGAGQESRENSVRVCAFARFSEANSSSTSTQRRACDELSASSQCTHMCFREHASCAVLKRLRAQFCLQVSSSVEHLGVEFSPDFGPAPQDGSWPISAKQVRSLVAGAASWSRSAISRKLMASVTHFACGPRRPEPPRLASCSQCPALPCHHLRRAFIFPESGVPPGTWTCCCGCPSRKRRLRARQTAFSTRCR
jgi:hypothetical protein